MQLQQLPLQQPSLPPGGAGAGAGEPDVGLNEEQGEGPTAGPRPLCAAADAELPVPSRDPT